MMLQQFNCYLGPRGISSIIFIITNYIGKVRQWTLCLVGEFCSFLEWNSIGLITVRVMLWCCGCHQQFLGRSKTRRKTFKDCKLCRILNELFYLLLERWALLVTEYDEDWGGTASWGDLTRSQSGKARVSYNKSFFFDSWLYFAHPSPWFWWILWYVSCS